MKKRQDSTLAGFASREGMLLNDGKSIMQRLQQTSNLQLSLQDRPILQFRTQKLLNCSQLRGPRSSLYRGRFQQASTSMYFILFHNILQCRNMHTVGTLQPQQFSTHSLYKRCTIYFSQRFQLYMFHSSVFTPISISKNHRKIVRNIVNALLSYASFGRI